MFFTLFNLQPGHAENPLFPKTVVSSSIQDQDLMFAPDAKARTRETLEERGGILYRRVDFHGKSYYLQLSALQGNSDEMKVLCQQPGGKSEPLIRVGVKVIERSFAFIEGLRVACESKGSDLNSENFRTRFLPEIAIGFSIDDHAGPQILRGLKNKRIIVWPFVGFAADTP